MRRILILLIRAYRYFISPLIGPNCRFTPSCSEYAMLAISKHGVARGAMLSFNRVLRCNPWHPGGHDPVP